VAQKTTAAGAVAMFGLFAGLCAIVALLATFVDWRDERAREQWPVATATIDRGAVDTYRNSRGGIRWQLRYRVRYEVDGKPQAATLTSRSTQSSEEAGEFEAWAKRHRRGRKIAIRYDPAQPGEAAFASPEEVPGAGSRVTTDLQLAAIAAIACIVLIPLGKHLAARQARDSGGGEIPGRVSIGWGVTCASIGFLEIALGLHAAMVATHPLTSGDFVVVPAGLIFVFAGVLLGLPPGREGPRRVFAALLVSAFAITFDWIAFGPGERQFSGAISLGIGVGFHPGEWFGRAAFAIPAVIMTCVAAVMWTRLALGRP
jgi:hypothetical protein